MSAFLVSGKHIATVAAIIGKYSQFSAWGKKDDLEIRRELLNQNARSIAWRYSPEGQAEYARIFGDLDAYLEKTWGKNNIVSNGFSPETAPKDLAPLLMLDPETGMDGWLDDCQTAWPLHDFSAAESYRYLSCFAYQSCEHEGWKESDAKKWITWTLEAIADRMASMLLKDRHVWSI